MFLLIVADITRQTGRFNVAQGALITLLGIGASLSNLIAEQIVQFANYSAAFLFLAGVALVGTLLFGFFMPETAPSLQSGGAAGTSDTSGRLWPPPRPLERHPRRSAELRTQRNSLAPAATDHSHHVPIARVISVRGAPTLK